MNDLPSSITSLLATTGVTASCAAELLGKPVRTVSRQLRAAGYVNRSGRWFLASVARPPWGGGNAR